MTPSAVADLSPGLVFLAVVCLTSWGLRRLGEALPAAVVALALALPAWIFAPALFGGRYQVPFDNLRGYSPFETLAPAEPHGNPVQGDLLLLALPAAAETRRQLVAGRWPLISDRMGGGAPLLADPQSQALQPLALAAQLLPAARAAGARIALGLALGLLFTFCFLRRQGLGAGAAAAGGLAWGLGGFLFLWSGWPIAATAVWLPALLLAIARCFDSGDRREVVVTAAAAAGLLLAGHPETIAYALGAAALFATARAVRARSARRQVALARLAAGGALAVAVVAPVWLPTLAALPESLRAARIAEAPPPAPQGFAERAIERLVPIVSPNAFGNSRYAAYWGRSNTNEDATGFVGTATLLMAIVGAAGLFRGRRRRAEEWLFAALGLAALAVIALPPGLYELLRSLPMGRVSDFHHRLLLLVAFATAYLAACELDRRAAPRDEAAGERRTASFRAAARAVAPITIVAAALAALVVWSYAALGDPDEPERLDVVRYGWLLWHLRLLGAGVLLAWVGHRRRWLPVAFALLIAGELLLAHRIAHPPMPARLALPDHPAIAALAAPDRATRAQPGSPGPERITALGSALPPNLAALYGLSDARLYNPMTARRYAAVLAAAAERWRGEIPELGSERPEILDLLGVGRLLTTGDVGLHESAAPLFELGSLRVWRRPTALPTVFFPAAVETLPAGDLSAVLAAAGSFAERSWVEGPAAGRPRLPWRAGSPRAIGVLAATAGPSHRTLRIAAAEPRLAATSLVDDGGWRAVIDGRRRPAARTNGAFVGVWLPAGAHRLDLVYRPPGFAPGMLVAALALAVAAAFVSRPQAPRRAPEDPD